MQNLLSSLSGAWSVSPRGLFDMVFSLALAIVMALVAAQLYKYTHRGLSYELAFMKTLVLLAPIVTSVMLFIRGDLVLSLGLVGSLSIVRFRAPIKDTRDMVFLFWIISIGLGCGTYNWAVVLVTTLLMSAVMIALHVTRYGVVKARDFVLVVSGDSAPSGLQIAAVLHRYAQQVTVRSQEIDGDRWEIVYEIYVRQMNAEHSEKLTGEIRALEHVRKVSLLAPQIILPA